MILSNRERQAPLKISDAEPSHLARYKFVLNYLKKSNSVLDVPCGTGYGTSLLSSKAFSVCGLDNYTKAIEHSKEFFQLKNNHFFVGNMQNMMPVFQDNAHFDVIVSFEGVEHIKRPKKFLKEVSRLLKEEGLFIISTPRKLHGNPYHFEEYSFKSFISLLSSYFDIEEMFGQTYTTFFNLSENNLPEKSIKLNFLAICKKKSNSPARIRTWVPTSRGSDP